MPGLVRKRKATTGHPTESSFRDTGWLSNLPYSGMKLVNHKNFQQLHILSLFLHQGSKLSLCLLYRQQFLQWYRPIFKIAICWYKNWHWQYSQMLDIFSLSITKGWTRSYFGYTGSGFRDTGCVSELPYSAYGHELDNWKKIQKLHMCSFFIPGVEWSWFSLFALWAAVSETRVDFQNCHIRS